MAKPPTDDDLRDQLADRIAVDHTVLVRAKEALLQVVLRDHITDGGRLVDAVVKGLGAIDPGTLYLDRSIDFDAAQLSPYAEFYSAKLAACEAMWQLLHGGLLIPGHVSSVAWTPSVNIEPPPGQGGAHTVFPLTRSPCHSRTPFYPRHLSEPVPVARSRTGICSSVKYGSRAFTRWSRILCGSR